MDGNLFTIFVYKILSYGRLVYLLSKQLIHLCKAAEGFFLYIFQLVERLVNISLHNYPPQLAFADAGGFIASPRIIINQARLGRTRLSSFVRNSIFSELQRNVILSFFPLSFSLVLNSFLCKNQGKSFK